MNTSQQDRQECYNKKRKKIHYQPRSATNIPHISDVLQLAEPEVRILFADAGCIHPRLKQALIPDAVKELRLRDLLEAAADHDASIVLGSDFPLHTEALEATSGGRFTDIDAVHSPVPELQRPADLFRSWHVWYHKNMWRVQNFRVTNLAQGRQCATINLLHKSGFETAVMLVKNLKGKSAAPHSLRFSIVAREEVMNAVVSFLLCPRHCPAIVAGDLGVGLATVHHHLVGPTSNNPFQIRMQSYCNENQSFHILVRDADGAYECNSIATHSLKMMVFQSQRRSGERSPTAKRRKNQPTAGRQNNARCSGNSFKESVLRD